jgi:hypothetical protein
VYKQYLIIAEKPDHSDTKVYWDSTEAEALSDIQRLKAAGYEVEGFRETTTEHFDATQGKFLHV